MSCQELSGRSYKVVLGWSLSLLDLKAHGRGHTANQLQLLPVPDLQQLRKCPGHPEAYHCLLIASKAQLLKDPWVVCKLGEARALSESPGLG